MGSRGGVLRGVGEKDSGVDIAVGWGYGGLGKCDIAGNAG